MKIDFCDSLLKKLFSAGKKDQASIIRLPKKYMRKKNPLFLARMLLTRDVAVELIAEQLLENPSRTYRALDALSSKNGMSAPQRSRKRGRPPKAAVVETTTFGQRRGRKHLSAKKVEKLKENVRVYLRKKPGSAKKDIIKAARIPSVGIYNRLMYELKGAGEIYGEGEKRNVVYFLM